MDANMVNSNCNGNQHQKLPVGVDGFEKLRRENFYYIDKTSMIRDLLQSWGEVNLFTRPRRFGKSLNMSMLKSFFEIGSDATLFDGLEISKETDLCDQYMGKFPVILISLKGIEGNTYEFARNLAVKVINEEARRLQFLLESENLSAKDKELYTLLLNSDMDDETLVYSLKEMSEFLYKHYGKKVIILIDEYDVPLAKANQNGYYKDMVGLIRGMFNQALKTNDSLQFAVMTGCLRVSKESIFTGLNNPKVFTVSDNRFSNSFGFTDEEVIAMLEYYGADGCYETTKEWYNGYRFGDTNVYCPWDVINFCDELRFDLTARPKNYWINSSGNDVVRRFVACADAGRTKSEIEALVAGEVVTKEIHEELTYNEMYESIDNIWSVLYTTGYLTLAEKPMDDNYRLQIPNREIRNIFTQQIMALFKENVRKDGERLSEFCDALKTGDAAEVERIFTDYLDKTITIRDTAVRNEKKENYFHGILVGILGFKDEWYVKSNEQTGDGYCDILIEIEREDIGIIIEVKYADRAKYTEALDAAFHQIKELDYVNKLRNEDFHTVYKYAIACFKRRCRVRCEKEIFEAEE
ncbi:MAG: ATP-binding protein [Lachnospiraceae bacterium]|nr:ATP-binding protein [Lachnospiraceae bacterium]